MSTFVGDALPEQFRLLVEQVKEYAIFLLDPDGHIVSWNAGAEKIKGYSEEDILGEHFSIFYPEEEAQSGTPKSALEAAAREGQWVDEGWRIRQDGTRFWARVTITALRTEGSIRGFAKVTRDMTERRRLEEELLRVQEEEQQRLSRELHDAVGSMLTAATLKVGKLIEAAKKGERIAPEELEEINKHIEDAGDEARSVAHGLNPVGVEEGLPTALQKLADQAEVDGNLSCTADLQASVSDLPDNTATQLYRIAQEALNNAVKHADADRIQVRLERTSEADRADRFVLTIRDDGKGVSSSSIDTGLGMRTMRHRASTLGGTLSLEQPKEGGTVLRCRVPVPARQ